MGYKYKTLIEFKNDYPSEYRFLYKKNLLSKLCEDMGWKYNVRKRPGYWNKETALETAKKYTTKRDWKKFDKSGYEYARTQEWYEECILHMIELTPPSGYWTKERCVEEANKYTVFKDWQTNSPGSIKKARDMGWLEELRAHMKFRKITFSKDRKPIGYWSKERFISECLKYGNYKSLRKNSPSSVESARSSGYLNEVMELLNWETRKKGYRMTWTKESCMGEALKYKTRVEWQKNSTSSYSSSRANGWYKECTAHMERVIKPTGYWNKERCIENALKYDNKEDWKKNNNSANGSARKNGWYKECVAHMVSKTNPPNYWGKERCMEEALNYKTRTEWRNGNQTSYNKAIKNGWIEECAAHMETKKLNQWG